MATRPAAGGPHLFYGVALHDSTGDVRLIGNDQQKEVTCFESRQRLRSSGRYPQVREFGGSVGLAIPNHGLVQHAVAVEKNGAAQRSGMVESRPW